MAGATMARKKSAEATVRIEADVAKLAKIVSSFEDRSISEILGEILRPALQKRYAEHLRKAQDDLNRETPSKPPKR